MLALREADDTADVLDSLGDGTTNGPLFRGYRDVDGDAPVDVRLTGHDSALAPECSLTGCPAVVLARGEVARADSGIGLVWRCRAVSNKRFGGGMLVAIS